MPLSLDQFLFSGSGASAEIQLEAELLREEKDLLKEGLERIRGIATSFFNLEIEEDELQQRVCCSYVCVVAVIVMRRVVLLPRALSLVSLILCC